jgi:hypothetical protein
MGKKIILGLVGFVLLHLLSAAGALYALAYHVIELDSYPEIQQKVEFFVMELPGTPKSPKYVLYKAITSEKTYTSNSFDISAAVNSSSSSGLSPLTNFDIEAKGETDITDPKNPLFTMNLSITKDFNMDIRGKDKFVYFKVNAVPSYLLAMVGLNADLLAPLTNTWVSYDTTPLQTDARKLLDESQAEEDSTITGDAAFSEIQKYVTDDMISKMILIEGEDEGVKVHKIKLDATPEMIDSIVAKVEADQTPGTELDVLKPSLLTQKPSDVLKNLSVEIWLDSSTYYTRRVAVTFKFTPDSKLSQSVSQSDVLGVTDVNPSLGSEISVAMVMKFSGFGNPVVVDVPSDAITFDEYSARIATIMRELYSTPSELPIPDNQ